MSTKRPPQEFSTDHGSTAFVRKGDCRGDRAWSRLLALMFAVGVASVAIAQDKPKSEPAPPAPGQPASNPPSPTAPPADSPKSLDDLLGVPGQKDSATSKRSEDDAATREQAKRLERSLDGASLDDLVLRAVDGMKSAAERLGDAKDPGIGTQRIQEDVVKTLDRLLEEAQKQQKRQSSSSKSKRQSGKPQTGQQDPKEQNGQQSGGKEQQPSRSQDQRSTPGEENSQGDRPPDQSATDGTELDEARIEWGRLPERVRELVIQGRRDRVSTIYERLTREYYRRLAEEASK
ncbi:MAG: hypothetical protein RLY21_1586 [Planctomycetota bacterium]